MSRRITGFVAAACAVLLLAACGKAPPDPPAASATGEPPVAELPAVVATALAEIAAECTAVGGKPDTQDAVRRVDLNADSREDYVLYTGWVMCEGAVSVYGDRAKRIAVFTGDGQGGAAESFADWTYDAQVEGDPTMLWLVVAGGNCGRPPAPDFASEAFCQRAVTWNAAAGSFGFAPVDTVRMIE